MARKILLADDSVTAQNMGRKILTDAGYEVVTVNNGSAALKKIAEGKPDLIVLDVYMPGYSGLEVCQRIKENRETARIPILLTVGKLEPFKPEEARRAKADAFVVKPFEASELLSALTKLEDKIIPQAEPYKQGRFAKAVASVDQEPEGEKFGDTDEGWKARLRIPTGKPKVKDTEPDPDYASTQGKGFRDFVEPPPAKKNAPPAKAAADNRPERPLPTGIPHDITPEEIAAITAAAAQLNGKAAPASVEQESTKQTTSAPADIANAEDTAQESGPVTFASSPQVVQEPESVSSQVPGDFAVVADAHEAEPLAEEAPGVDTPPLEATAVEAGPVEAALVDAPAAEPVVEPTPAQAETAPAEIASEPAAIVEAAIEAPVVEATTPVVENAISPDVEAARATIAEILESRSVSHVPETATVPVEETASAVPTAAVSEENTVSKGPEAPVHDEEVMAALDTLIPTAAVSDTLPTADASRETLPSAFAQATSAVQVTNAHAAGPRWLAEEVALGADEATLSLEREMEAAYAAFAAQTNAQAATAQEPAVAQEPASPVTDAVAEVVPAVQPEVVEHAAVYAMASAAGAGEASPMTAAVSAPALVDSGAIQPTTENDPEHVPQFPGETARTTEAVELATAATDVIGGETMAASWKNIRDSIAGAAPKPAPAKEEFREAEPAYAEADAVSAASASAPVHAPATDPTAIANIVDSVLAELRPKIVEEIARKLADTKKD